MKRTLLFIACVLVTLAMLAQGSYIDDSDYLPFVKEGKNWHVVRSDFDSGFHFVRYMFPPNEKLEEDETGKTYFLMYMSEDDLAPVLVGALREEDRKVYLLSTEALNYLVEYLVFDYSLKEGDCYEAYSFDEEKMVSYKVISVDDYQEGPEVIRYDYDEDGNMITHRRYLKKWTVCRTDNELHQKTWIEGVGSIEGPLENLRDVVLPNMSWDYLAYVDDNYGDIYLPFSFCDTWNRLGYGCNMPTGAEAHSADGHHQLTYELEGDRLHVYGKVLTRGSLNNYAYFIEEQSDDSSVRKLHFKIQAIGPIPDPLPGSDGLYLHTSDFYVEGLDPNMNYIVVDSQGEEYPVVNKTAQMPYHPFVEDGKVWKVGYGSDNPIQYVEYYYFDSDTIVDGKTCKQMMSQRYVTPDYADYEAIMRLPLLRRNGVWYEEDKKVYVYDDTNKQFILWYDFSLDAYAPLWLAEYAPPYVLGPRQTGGIKGFKGVHRDVMISAEGEYHYNITWLEGVGSIEGPVYNVYYGKEYHGGAFLMSCTVGDEVIYLNDEYEDGATPAEARKRFDFTHTVKTKPKAPRRAMLGDGCFVMGVGARATSPAEAELSLYGEYNEQQLGIHLDPLDDAYQVRITDETGKAVYEKAVNAGNIVGLNIDISAYAEGRYTVTMENSQEAFTGLFEVQTTGISDAERLNNNEEMINESIYNLQGQRISSLKKGMNIVNGQKVYVK